MTRKNWNFLPSRMWLLLLLLALIPTSASAQDGLPLIDEVLITGNTLRRTYDTIVQDDSTLFCQRYTDGHIVLSAYEIVRAHYGTLESMHNFLSDFDAIGRDNCPPSAPTSDPPSDPPRNTIVIGPGQEIGPDSQYLVAPEIDLAFLLMTESQREVFEALLTEPTRLELRSWLAENYTLAQDIVELFPAEVSAPLPAAYQVLPPELLEPTVTLEPSAVLDFPTVGYGEAYIVGLSIFADPQLETVNMPSSRFFIGQWSAPSLDIQATSKVESDAGVIIDSTVGK